MTLKLIPRSSSAYDFPLIIRHLLHTTKQIAGNVEVVYRDIKRMTYNEFLR